VKRPALPTIVVAEDSALLRDGIASICESSGRFSAVTVAADGEAALTAIRAAPAGLALLSLSLSRIYAIEVLRQARAEGLDSRIVLMSPRTDRKTVIEALRNGAQGYFVSSASGQALIDCLDRVAEGGVYVSPEVDVQALFSEKSRTEAEDPLALLSAREHQVFSLLIEGVRAKEIAARLNLSTKTVDTYRASLMRKLGIYDVAGLVKFAIERRIIGV
jgi:DNA-binding NarL/FixJ family response regulator